MDIGSDVVAEWYRQYRTGDHQGFLALTDEQVNPVVEYFLRLTWRGPGEVPVTERESDMREGRTRAFGLPIRVV